MQKEVMAVAKAKGVSESDIMKMGTLEYYQTLAVLESYNRDVEAMSKKGNGQNLNSVE